MASCIQVFVFKEDGNAHYFDDAPNAWGGAYTIWKTLANKYKLPFELNNAKIAPIWKLTRCKDVPKFERIVLISTFDGVWVRRENIPMLVNALKDFCASTLPEHGKGLASVTLDTLSSILLLAISDTSVRGVGFNSVNTAKSFWSISTEDGDRPYNIKTDKGHFELLEELEAFGQDVVLEVKP